MDLLDLIKLIFRRWYVTAPIIALAVAATVGVGVAIRPEYRSTVAIVLMPPTGAASAPEASPTAGAGNPWARIGPAAMAQAVQIAASSHDARERVRAAGGDPDYTVELVSRSSILTIEVAADSAVEALATARGVTTLIDDEVARRQAPYQPAPGDQITVQVLDPGRDVEPSRSNVLRLQIVVMGIGLLVAAAAAVGYDAAARHLAARARRTRSGVDRPGDGADGPDHGADRHRDGLGFDEETTVGDGAGQARHGGTGRQGDGTPRPAGSRAVAGHRFPAGSAR